MIFAEEILASNNTFNMANTKENVPFYLLEQVFFVLFLFTPCGHIITSCKPHIISFAFVLLPAAMYFHTTLCHIHIVSHRADFTSPPVSAHGLWRTWLADICCDFVHRVLFANLSFVLWFWPKKLTIYSVLKENPGNPVALQLSWNAYIKYG